MKKIEVTVTLSQTFKIDPECLGELGLDDDSSMSDIQQALEAWVEENICDFASDNYAGCDLKEVKDEG